VIVRFGVCTLLALLLGTGILAAQAPSDSLLWEQRLGDEGVSDERIGEAGRRMLLGFLRSEDEEGVDALIAFMDRRIGVDPSSATPWLEPRERLMVEIARAHADTVATPAVVPLLRTAILQPYLHRSVQDRFTLELGDYLLHYTPRMTLRLKEEGADEAQRLFHLLLVNRFSTVGVRARADVNGQIRRFIALNPASSLVPVAEQWLITPYQESDFGGAVAVGWEQGGWSGAIADRLDGASGPSIELEGYIDRLTVVGGFAGATVEVPEAFLYRGDSILPGRVGLRWVRAMVGYELRVGRTAFTPLLGLAEVGWARNDGNAGGELRGGTTWSGGVQVGYRVLPADTGPHVDLRVRLAATGSGLDGGDRALTGTRWSVQVGLAVVARPMIVLP